MSRKPRSAKDDAPKAKVDIQRVRVNAQGYDDTGAYWGAGPDVFIATTADDAREITVRAKSITDARVRVAAELARPLGQLKIGAREPLGGASPNKARFEVDWRDPVAGTSVRIRVTHSRDYLGQGQDHIEVESIVPRKAPLPITETGYRSHFSAPLDLVNAGGPVTFVTAWLNCEAKGKDWQKRVNVRQQGDLFQWAEVQGQVTHRNSAKLAPAPKSPAAKKRPSVKRPKPA